MKLFIVSPSLQFNFMNKVFICLTLLLLTNKLKAQNLNETISYINTLLKASTYNFKFPNSPSEYENIYDTISVDEHGKIQCIRFLSESKTGKASSAYRFYAYLKALQIGNKKDYTNYYVMTLICTASKLCFGGIGVERADVYFSISTASNRDKLHNAFSHLLDLAKDNKAFYEKDPFEN